MLDGEGVPEALGFPAVGYGWQEAIGASLPQQAVFWPWIGCTLILSGCFKLLQILALRSTTREGDGRQSGRGAREKGSSITALRLGRCRKGRAFGPVFICAHRFYG